MLKGEPRINLSTVKRRRVYADTGSNPVAPDGGFHEQARNETNEEDGAAVANLLP